MRRSREANSGPDAVAGRVETTAAAVSDEEDLDVDEDDSECDSSRPPELQGTLSKWTNYLHGWQERFVVLKDGALSYFKTESERSFGCRGSVSLAKATISRHQFDDCRFDIAVNDSVWYMRAGSSDERQQWLDALESHKHAESGYGSDGSLRRHGSCISVASGTSLSTTASTSSFKRGRGLPEKLAEMETFRDILCRQVDTLQSYFDACAQALAFMQQSSVHDNYQEIDDAEDRPLDSAGHTVQQTKQPSLGAASHGLDNDIAAIFQQHSAHAIDFKGEAITFKATTAGIIATLSYSLDLMSQREETWKKRLERETERRKKFEVAYRQLLSDVKKNQRLGGPDCEEGPHCAIAEDEFFDAVDASLDRLELESQIKYSAQAARQPDTSVEATAVSSVSISTLKDQSMPGVIRTLTPGARYYDEVNFVIDEHMKYLDTSIDNGIWELFHEEGEMRVYRRELEEDGMIVDPLKAIHTVTGVTGHEICHRFWDLDVRMEWEGTLESAHLLETVAEDTVVTQQLYKRVWPTTQRDSLFWSHIRRIPSKDEDAPDYWIVCNYSADHPKAMQTKCVRIKINVALICQTIVSPPKAGSEVSRNDITCKIQYSANVNPGGWAPPSVLRAVYKREYPKFLKRFTQYVKDATVNKPIMF